jgi:hypothetical protein
MQTIARSHNASEAWYAQVPLSMASRIVDGHWSDADPTTPTWVVIMHGNLGGGGSSEPIHWAAVALDPRGNYERQTTDRIDTFGAKLMPLSLQ